MHYYTTFCSLFRRRSNNSIWDNEDKCYLGFSIVNEERKYIFSDKVIITFCLDKNNNNKLKIEDIYMDFNNYELDYESGEYISSKEDFVFEN